MVRWGLRRGAWLITSYLAWGCAPVAAPQTAKEVEAPAPVAMEEEPKVAPLPALQSVPTPEGVVARLRISSPSKLADGVLDAASIPFDLAKGLRAIDGEYSFLKAMDLEGPVEGAVVLNPQEPTNPSRFLSVGVVSVDEVLKELESSKAPVQEGPRGVYYFKVGRDPCAVGRSMGISPARVVCSDRRGGLNQILSYALRGLPNEPLSQADVYSQVDFRPIRKRYKKELDRLRLLASVFARQGHVGHAKFDRALTDAAIGLADELSRLALESEQVVFEVHENKGSLKVTMKAQFDGHASTTVQSLRVQAQLSQAAPEVFSSLPSTTASAWYMRELPTGSIDTWMSIFADLATGYAEYRGASLEFATRLSRVVQFLGPQGRTHLQARGPVVSSVREGRPMAHAAWAVWGMSQPKAEVDAFLDDWSYLLASPDWSKFVQSDQVGASLKRVRRRIPGATGAAVYSWSLSEETVNQLDSDLRAPAGTDPKQWAEAAKQLYRGHLATYELDGTTFLSWSTGDGLSQIEEAFSALSTPDVERLADRAEYNSLLALPAVGAGFFTLLGVGSELWSFAPPDIVRDLSGLLNATPHRGLVPLTMSFRTSAAETTESEYTMVLPREFTQDAATMAAILFAELNFK